MHLFQEGKPFFKGNLHCHTTQSDGVLSPDQTKSTYRNLGYDFLAITDHRILSEPAHLEEGMLLLPGAELDYSLPGQYLHLIGIGMDPDFDPRKACRTSPQTAIQQVRRHGGRVILAHPAWSLNTMDTLCALRDISAAEIYNSVSTHPWNGDRADSSVLLDICAAHGTLYPFVASDDSHDYDGEQGRAFTMVQADELTQEAVFAALDAGFFYCSQGPAFEQISVENDRITLRCSPVETAIFYSNMPWAEGRCITAPGLTEASYDLTVNSSETFIRCQIIDAQGKSAWSNPISLA